MRTVEAAAKNPATGIGQASGASGSCADCGWTPVQGSAALYIRRNGRAYRLVPTKDKRLDLWRIKDADDKGTLVGTYSTRGDAVKALKVLAYQPEPRW